jgi:hypothetical protein
VGGLGAAFGWVQAKPDLFDAFSCGMTILQAGDPLTFEIRIISK